MKVELINNTGIQNLRRQLEDQMLTCNSFNIASAFITSEALQVLQTFLIKNKAKNRIGRLLISLYQCFNTKEILQNLFQLQKKSNGKLQVNISRDKKFHWKHYYFKNSINNIAYIGSANFTKGGMEQRELTTKITLQLKEKSLGENIVQIFNDEWENSISILDFPINKYKSSSIAIQKTTQHLHPDILKLLKEVKTKDKEKNNSIPEFAIKLFGFLSVKTKKLITQSQSHWDKYHWNYYACNRKIEYDKIRMAKTVLIINKYSNKYSFAISVIKSYCKLDTPDGNYFIAFKEKTKADKKETDKLRSQIENLGLLYHSNNFFYKRLTIKQGEAIKSFFS